MSETAGAEQVGDQDPELGNSPIADETGDAEYDPRENVSGNTACLFNDKEYPDGTYVCSGHTLLRCDRGIWIPSGSSDPDNP